jgi:hypothetical protein
VTEVQIRHAQFHYYVETEGVNRETGEKVPRLARRIATRDQVVDIPRQEDIDRGEAYHAFYTEDDYAEQEREAAEAAGDDIADATTDGPASHEYDDLVAWIRDAKPNAARVVEEAGTDGELAQLLIDAENEASGGDPRKSVTEPLTKIASQTTA